MAELGLLVWRLHQSVETLHYWLDSLESRTTNPDSFTYLQKMAQRSLLHQIFRLRISFPAFRGYNLNTAGEAGSEGWL